MIEFYLNKDMKKKCYKEATKKNRQQQQQNIIQKKEKIKIQN